MVKVAFGEDAAVAAGAASVAALAWRHRGVLRVTVVAKATFAFAHDAVMPRAEPQPIFRREVNHGNNPTRSTRFAADLAPYLERAEILFTGHAYPPGGHPLETLPVRLGVFAGGEPVLDKMLILRKKGGFERMPLVYERAYGGIGWPDNPLGVGALAGSGEPTIFDPGGDTRLAGFGPIGGAWAARRKLLGNVPRKALEQSFLELPDDLDFGYFQSAPPDQRIPFLRGDEWIVMDGLHPTLPRTRMRLPGARGLALVYGLSPWGVAEGQPLALHADTLRIDGDDLRCALTFRGAFPVAAEEALAGLRVVAGVELPGEPITWPSREVLAARAAVPEVAPSPERKTGEGDLAITLSEEDFESVRGDVLDGTLSLGPEAHAARPAPALPFQPGPAPEAIARGSGAPPEPRGPRKSFTLPLDALPDRGPAMPFRPAPSAPPPPAPPPPEPPPPEPPFEGEGTLASHMDPAPPPPATPEKKPADASPWAPAPAAPARAPAPPPPPQGPPPATPKLKKGLYGRFGGNG